MKRIILSAAICFVQFAQATDFVDMRGQIGCGTITSVRNLNQAPLYNYEYESAWGKTNSGSLASVANGFGLIGFAGAVIGSIAVDTVVSSNSAPIEVKPPSEGAAWKDVRAVRIELDDGRQVNLPLMVAGKLDFASRTYQVGERVRLQYHKQLNNIQLMPKGLTAPKPGEDKYERNCALRANKLDADTIVKASENLVNEANIIE